MSKRKKKQTRATCSGSTAGNASSQQLLWLLDDGDICVSGYTSLDKNPEIMAACYFKAQLLASVTIHLMENTDGGDKRITNELSRKIDIEPEPNMTRSVWMESILMNLLLYGKGNSIVIPHTWKGFLQSLEPVSASRVSFMPAANSYREYSVLIDGIAKKPENLLHFRMNPDPDYMWKGRGITVNLQDLAHNLKQATATEKAFMSSEYKPSIIVKIDALTDEFSSPEGRQKLLDSYVKPSKTGEPWLIPAEQFDVVQVKPLSLADLAISDTVKLDKQAVAAIVGVPSWVVGVGEYKKDEWNTFINTQIMPLAKNIAAEMTRKLINNPKWYLTFNVWSLLDFDLKTVSDVLLAGSDRGFVNGDEWRDRVHLSPAGLKEFRVLENYIPFDMAGMQKKLVGNE